MDGSEEQLSSSTEPQFQAVNAQDATVQDPSDADLRELLSQLGPGNQFLVLHRLQAVNDEYYAQVWCAAADHYEVEYRDGSAEQHYQTTVDSPAAAQVILSSWAAALPGWRQTWVWTQVTV